MNITCYTSANAFAANGYIVTSEKGNSVLVDAPLISGKILDSLDADGVKITKILLTHGHCDHIDSLALLAEKYGAEVYIHEADEKKLHDDYLNLSEYFGSLYPSPVPHYNGAKTVRNGDTVVQDELSFRVLHTPGHTSGSVCYFIGDVIFTGDTLFRDSVGRTDMPDGDPNVLAETLDELFSAKRSKFDGDFNIFSGHGPASVLKREWDCNPYLKGNFYDSMF